MKWFFFLCLILFSFISCTKEFNTNPKQTYNVETGMIKNLSDSGLIDLYEFTGIFGDTVLNGVNPSNYGIIHGGITICPDRFNNPDRAIQIDGADGSYISTIMGGPLGNSPRSISMWFKTSSSAMQYLFGYGSIIYVPHCFGIGMNNYCEGIGTDDGAGLTTRDTVLSTGTWQNLVVVFHPLFGNTMVDVKFYIRGAEWVFLPGQLCGDWPSNIINTIAGCPYYFGSDLDGGRCFNGCIDDIRIYNRALNEEEIYELYIAPDPTPNPTPMLQYHASYDTCQL